MAGGRGLEPRLTGSKPVFLPIERTPINGVIDQSCTGVNKVTACLLTI